jgi:hypothetical protein
MTKHEMFQMAVELSYEYIKSLTSREKVNSFKYDLAIYIHTSDDPTLKGVAEVISSHEQKLKDEKLKIQSQERQDGSKSGEYPYEAA